MKKRSYYYDRMIPLFVSAGIKSEDKMRTVLVKFDKMKGSLSKPEFVALKAFLKNFWSIESRLKINSQPLYSNWQSGFGELEPNRDLHMQFKDPALGLEDTYIVKTPDAKYVNTEDTMFLRCPNCGGRLYPQFQFCPYCAFDLKGLPEGVDINPIVVPDVPTPDTTVPELPCNGPGGGMGNRPRMGMGLGVMSKNKNIRPVMGSKQKPKLKVNKKDLIPNEDLDDLMP